MNQEVLSQIERRNKKYAQKIEASFVDGQVHCPRKGPLRPATSVVSCMQMHNRDPDECGRCGCRLHMVAEAKVHELEKISRTQ